MESRTGDSGSSDEDFASRRGGEGLDEQAQAAEPRRRSRSARRSSRSGPDRSKLVRGSAIVLVVALLGFGASSLGPVRTILRQSFTDQAAPSVDFYFNGAPYVSGEWLEVPLGVLNAPAGGAYEVQLWTVDDAGKVQSSGTAKLAYTRGRGAANVNLLLRGDGQIVWARLVGTPLTVHYRFEGSPLTSPSASATPAR